VANELAYALITPYSLLKSRTGGIIGRLMVLGDLELVGVHMYAPSDAFVDEYLETVREQRKFEPQLRDTMLQYVDENFRPDNAMGISNRTMLLLFKGENARETLWRNAIGRLSSEPRGDTVRGTYGDFVSYPNGDVKFFEPAVLTAVDLECNLRQLEIFAKYARSDGGVVEKAVKLPPDAKPETTLVILKPENFSKKSVKPGNIVDIFSKTGLFIVGAKLIRMSVAQAMEFYGPLLDVFPDKLKGNLAHSVKTALSSALNFQIDDETVSQIAELLKDAHARHEFNQIIEYMTGLNPDRVPPEEYNRPGRQKTLALLYHGVDAVNKIRERLGPTDPSKAPAGTVRSDFGATLMSNAAHASDSVENALRERKIIGLTGTEDESCDVLGIVREIRQYLDSVK